MPKVLPANHVQVVLVSDHGSSGGTKTFATALATYLSKRNISFEVLTIDKQKVFELSEAHLQENRGLKFRNFFRAVNQKVAAHHNKLRPWIFKEQTLIRNYIESRFGQEVLVISSTGSPGRFLHLTDSPGRHIHFLHTYPHGLKHTIFGPALGIMSRKTGQLITVSKAAQNRLARVWWICKRRIAVIHNSASLVGRAENKKRAHSIVLTVGHVTMYKNPLLWVDIAAQVIERSDKELTFVWVGEGDLLGVARKKVNEKGLDNRIRFVGKQEDVTKFYQEAAVYLQVSEVESLGIAAIDALKFGVPQVVSKVGGLPEVTVDKETGFVVNHRKPANVADHILQMMNDPKMWEEFSEKSSARYNARFSSKIWHEKLDAIVFPALPDML